MDTCVNDEEFEVEEFEVEEVVDDLPMRVAPRLFLGSVDAARNTAVLQRAGVAFTLALLSITDHESGNGVECGDVDGVTRAEFAIEDALDAPLLLKLPALLDTLDRILLEAERADKSVLVHCVAGRSRSPALVAAWLIAQSPRKFASAEQAIGVVRDVRPWIDINAHFQRELQLFHRIATLKPDPTELLTRDEVLALVRRRGDDALPRVDFGASLVRDVLASRKTITMRLHSDVTDDANSDLQAVFAHSTVVATTAFSDDEHRERAQLETIGVSAAAATTRRPFALLRVDRVATKTLADLDAHDLAKSGFVSAAQVLSVLQQFYPTVTETTPLLMLHFRCVGRLCADDE